ncbi:DUF1571 domain-containing protein [Pandoraea anhela]|uniref:DUF1571 domain-containing protein n=1 Tax=Pandoraea anhela TaxID=2508295 RepID=A0A5E4RR47_9BURK|nr:DUF1571 domain-containing protein [Pandoraea anhela]VVD65251.1 hypothetical protein PAN31108_00323 [Pandoraea anhela]
MPLRSSAPAHRRARQRAHDIRRTTCRLRLTARLRSGFKQALLPVVLVAGALGAPHGLAKTNAHSSGTNATDATGAINPADTPASRPAGATTPDADIAKLAALPVAAQTQWLSRTIKSGELAKMSDDGIVARMQAIQPDALVHFLKAESAALPEYQYELTRHERINGQWQTTPDRMLVKIRESPRQIYAKWLPDGAHAGQEILYDETKRPKEMYGHLGGILGFTSIWSSIDGTLARSQSNHTVRDLGFGFIAEQIAHDGRSFRAAGLTGKPTNTSVSEVNGVRVLALDWDAPSGPPQHYASKSRVLLDLKTGRPRGIEAWDASGQKIEEMRFEKVRKEQWTDTTFDPRNPDYKF